MCIFKIIEHYENHIDYIEKDVSITKVMSWYCKTLNKRELKHYKDILEITKEYDDNFQYNYSEGELEESNNSKDDIEDLSSLSSSILISNYYSSSEEEEESNEENNIISI